MRKFDKVPAKKKVYKAMHLDPGEFCMNYILLPVGYSYNSEWLSAKKGDKIRMHDGAEYRIFCVRLIKVRGGLADILSRMRYGITIAGCFQRWKMNARLGGNASSAISTDECLWVIYEKDSDTVDGGLQV